MWKTFFISKCFYSMWLVTDAWVKYCLLWDRFEIKAPLASPRCPVLLPYSRSKAGKGVVCEMVAAENSAQTPLSFWRRCQRGAKVAAPVRGVVARQHPAPVCYFYRLFIHITMWGWSSECPKLCGSNQMHPAWIWNWMLSVKQNVYSLFNKNS